MLIDSHCHLTSPGLIEQIPAVLARAAAAGVGHVINVSVTAEDAAAALAALGGRGEVAHVCGVHPHEAARGVDEVARVAEMVRAASAQGARIVAIGETGLDFHYDFAPRPAQETVLRAQLALAVELGLPVVVHARLAEERVCAIIGEYPALAGRFVFHCFSAGRDVARQVLDGGGWLSFTGVLTFRNGDAVRDVATFAPLERTMIETDAPYLSPEPLRKIKPNEPALLVHTATRLAGLRGMTLAALAEQLAENTRRFFGWPGGPDRA